MAWAFIAAIAFFLLGMRIGYTYAYNKASTIYNRKLLTAKTDYQVEYLNRVRRVVNHCLNAVANNSKPDSEFLKNISHTSLNDEVE